MMSFCKLLLSRNGHSGMSTRSESGLPTMSSRTTTPCRSYIPMAADGKPARGKTEPRVGRELSYMWLDK